MPQFGHLWNKEQNILKKELKQKMKEAFQLDRNLTFVSLTSKKQKKEELSHSIDQLFVHHVKNSSKFLKRASLILSVKNVGRPIVGYATMSTLIR